MPRAMPSSGARAASRKAHARAGPSESKRRRGADAASRAGHQRMMAIERFVRHVAAACAAAALARFASYCALAE